MEKQKDSCLPGLGSPWVTALAVALEVISSLCFWMPWQRGWAEREGRGVVPVGIYKTGKGMNKRKNEKPKLVKAR